MNVSRVSTPLGPSMTSRQLRNRRYYASRQDCMHDWTDDDEVT